MHATPAPRSHSDTFLRRSAAAPRRRREGFALIVTVVLVAFLVLVLVGLATFTRVETQVATNTQSLAQARQNALLALNLAVGQLQKHTGPDQRVTATADLQPLAAVNSTNDPVSGQSLNSGSTSAILDNIDDYWRASRNRRWVGVWRDPDVTRSYVNPDSPAGTVPQPLHLAWLVSGNETNGSAVTPQTQVAGFTLANVTASDSATRSYGTAARGYRLLVGAKSAEIANGDDLDRAVLAPEVEITSTNVPGTDGSATTIGHYAWWVGDEGVKARANLVDDDAGSTDADENRLRLQSARRRGIETMTDLAAPLYPPNDPALAKILQIEQLPFVNSAAAFKTGLARRYHDITVQSRGVLSDVRNGGLKADLSWMLSHSGNATLRNELRAIYNDNTITATDSIVGRNVFTPYSSDPGTNAFANATYALGLSRASTWAQLRSYFNMGNSVGAANAGVIDAAGKARGRVTNSSSQGLNPLLVQAKLFYGLRINAAGAISLQVRPLVVLANPYDIALTGDYWVRFGRPSVYVYAGTFDTTNPAPSVPNLTDFARISSGPGSGPTSPGTPGSNAAYNDTPQPADAITYVSRFTLSIRAIDIPAGEARVYCLDQDYSHSGAGYAVMEMVEGYDDSSAITFSSPHTLGSRTHAALYMTSSNTDVRLYAVDPTSALNNKLAQYLYGRPVSTSGDTRFFVAYTTALDETRSGGGVWVTPDDAQFPSTQQANFLQYNPRTFSYFWTANSADDHPLENTRSSVRNGAPGNDAYFTADLMFDGAGDRVRWGTVNKGKSSPSLSGEAPTGVAADTGFVNILYSVPRLDTPLTSIAQLQHFSPSGYLNADQFISPTQEQFAVHANTFQVNYPTGNSYPNPRVPRDRAYYVGTSTIGSTNMGTAYDASWLYNDVLADRFFFSSFPAAGPFDFATDDLVNRNYRPFRDSTTVPWNVPTGFRGAPRAAAANLLSDGAFNINSTSREAWKSILASLRGVPVNGDSSVATPFSRTLRPAAGHASARNGNSADAWAGFHNLTDTEIEDLADEIVLQIRRRGPFLSLSDFMNRRLVSSANDPMDRGLSGALQSAIDAILNQASSIDAPFNIQSLNTNFAETAFAARTLASGAPGYILQADLLSPLAPGLAARSDTFVVRTYGDVNNPATGEITGRAWCEAVVQRLPDYVVPKSASGGNSPDEIPSAGSDNERFGRRYQIVSFRWLAPDDI